MIDYNINERLLTVFIHGEIDHHSAAGLRGEIDNLVRRYSPRCLILDFAKVDFCDSSGIAVVLGRYRLMRSLGGEVELTRLPDNVRHIFDLADLRKLVKIG
ncbi:MAG: anti-sigma factor antagonist [Clostridia bacterium]|jgi:stage II sporulation protein AA (anti-sigma F factor antagonist)|nr:anti-sigma factor antagonist [Clostridia bacterium]MBQ2273317.1 anti-sigma factor antagonist [Clostridia bacterium]MBQ5820783.1 anti-sigma factor antagonist [Clostridia bacterium]